MPRFPRAGDWPHGLGSLSPPRDPRDFLAMPPGPLITIIIIIISFGIGIGIGIIIIIIINNIIIN